MKQHYLNTSNVKVQHGSVINGTKMIFNLNTSNVKVQLLNFICCFYYFSHLNTSNVKVQLDASNNGLYSYF